MEVNNLTYSVDEHMVSLLARHLEDRDREGVKEIIQELKDRISGRCFCAARDSSCCVCGAWEGIWDE